MTEGYFTCLSLVSLLGLVGVAGRDGGALDFVAGGGGGGGWSVATLNGKKKVDVNPL